MNPGKTKSMSILDIKKIKKEERKRCWEEINKHIKTGKLQGNGCDEAAERNGLILATNIIFDLGI